MDSPDRMSWTPSSSAKKRKYEEFIDSCIHIRTPGAYPQSPRLSNDFNRSQYLLSPTPPSRFTRPGLSAQLHGPMLDNPNIPESLRRLYQMVANAGTTVQAISSSTVGILAGSGGRAARYIQNNIGPLYAAVEAIGNAAKRIKLTVRPQSVEPPSAPQPSTPPRRISQCINRTPTPAFRTQTSILRNTRERGLRKVRKTLRWVEDQQIINEASYDMVKHQASRLPSTYDHEIEEQLMENVEYAQEPLANGHPASDEQDSSGAYLSPIQDRRRTQAHTQISSEPVMSGALPSDDSEIPKIMPTLVDDTDTFSEDSYATEMMPHDEDSSFIASASSSESSDSVTPSLLEGLDEEDLRDVETREEKKARKKREAKEAFATMMAGKKTSNTFSEQLRAIHYIASAPIPPKKSVAFYNSPGTGHPVTLIKEYSSEDALTPPIKPYNSGPATSIRSSVKAYKGDATFEVPATPSANVQKSLRQLKSPAISPPVTPENVASSLSDLNVSNRRSSTRLDHVAAEEQIKREQEAALEAEEAERKAKEEAAQRAAEEAQQAEERIRLGIRRMPTGAVIQPLTAAWEDEVTRAMQTGLSSQRELARTSAGESIRRRDFGHVLPQSGIDPPAGWLNDTIITAYLQAVVDYGQKMRGVRRGALPKVHAFNTFFYKNLSEKGYDSVRRWATRAKFGGKDLLNMEKIFIPINKGGNHWVLAHVNPQSKTIEYFDSFHGSAGPVFDRIKAWLRGELRDAFVDSEWTLLQGQGPVQRNVSDCGVFCTTTAKMIVLGVDPMAFSAADMPTQRRRMLAELMNGGFEGDFAPNIVF
ncbi:MAG: hypothetical protein Q9225_005815 [Loekoesia sp. 1 TL-2023]